MQLHRLSGIRCCLFTLILLFVIMPTFGLVAQTQPVEGIRQNSPEVHALINGRIVVSPGNVIEKGTLILRDGMISAVGASVAIPSDLASHSNWP